MNQQKAEHLETVETMAAKVLGETNKEKERLVRQQFDDYATKMREEYIKSVERRAAELVKK
jgi:hypothetical protein